MWVGAVQVGAVQVGAVQVGAVQVGAVQVGAVQVGAVQLYLHASFAYIRGFFVFFHLPVLVFQHPYLLYTALSFTQAYADDHPLVSKSKIALLISNSYTAH